MKQVVIQSTRVDEHSPVPFSKEKILKNYHAQDVPFLLSAVPSLVETSDGGTGIGYTGMRVRGSDPTRINVTLNGVPLNDAESQGVYWVDLPDLAAGAHEIQVQRGVGSSTNGAGAFGATVNLDLSKIEAEPSASLANTLGSFGTRKHSFQAATGLLDSHFSFSGRFSTVRSDGYIDRASADLDAFHLSGAYISGRQTVQAHLISGHETTYQAWNGLPATYLKIPALQTFNTAGSETPDGIPYPNEVDNYRQRHALVHWKIDFGHGLFLQLNGHYTKGSGFYEQYKSAQKFEKYGLSPFQIGDSLLERTDLVRRRWLDNGFYGSTFALRFQPSINPAFFSAAPKFTLGGAESRYDGRHFGEIIWAQNLPPGIKKDHEYYENKAKKTDGNLFFQAEIFWSGGWASLLDLQVRRVGYRFLGFDQNLNATDQKVGFAFFNPKFGVSKKMGEKWTGTSFFGIGNREPNRDDFTQSTPGSRPKPERLFDTEIGLNFKENWIRASVNFFQMSYKNQLVLDGRINDVGAYIRTNIEKSHRTGIEVEVDARPIERLQLIGNVSVSQNKIPEFVEFLDNWDTGGQEKINHKNPDLAFSPNLTGRLEGSFDFLKNERSGVAANLVGKFVGKQFLDNTSNDNTALPRYFALDFRLRAMRRDWIGKETSLLLSVNNLLNTNYVSNGWAYRYRSGNYDDRPANPYTRLEKDGVYNQTGYFPQAGRHFMATVLASF